MSGAADRVSRPALPSEWGRLERVAEATAGEVAFWRRRSAEAEEEVARLRRALEELAATRERDVDGDREEVIRLRAENTALESRMLQARKRIGALLKRLSALELEP